MLKFEVKFVNLSHQNPHLENAKFEFSNLTHRLGLVCFFVKGKSLNYALLAALKKSASNSNKCSAAKHKASVAASSCLQAALADKLGKKSPFNNPLSPRRFFGGDTVLLAQSIASF